MLRYVFFQYRCPGYFGCKHIFPDPLDTKWCFALRLCKYARFRKKFSPVCRVFFSFTIDFIFFPFSFTTGFVTFTFFFPTTIFAVASSATTCLAAFIVYVHIHLLNIFAGIFQDHIINFFARFFKKIPVQQPSFQGCKLIFVQDLICSVIRGNVPYFFVPGSASLKNLQGTVQDFVAQKCRVFVIREAVNIPGVVVEVSVSVYSTCLNIFALLWFQMHHQM